MINLLNEASDSKFVTRKWNIVNDNWKANYEEGNEITYNTEVLKSNLCDYNDAYILVRGNVTVTSNMYRRNWWNNNRRCWKFRFSHVHLIEYSSNYSETTGSLWFYSKYGASNFNNNIANVDNFKSFKHKVKLLENTVAQPAPKAANGILRNATIAVSSRYLRNFWRSLEMSLINCKVELTLKRAKYCIFSAGGTENAINDVMLIILFLLLKTKLYVYLVSLSPRDNQKVLSKGFERSIYWNAYKTKSENKNTTNEYTYFPESNFVGANRSFVLVDTNEANNAKRVNSRTYYLPKGIIKSYNVTINGKNFYGQPIDSDMKQYKEIRNLTRKRVEDYTTTCLLDYEYIKNDRLVAVDLSRQKELDADFKAIQQIWLVGQLKKLDADDNATDAGNDQSMFVLRN